MTGRRRRSARWLLLLVVVLTVVVVAEALLLERWREGVKSTAREAPHAGMGFEPDRLWAPSDDLVSVGPVRDMVARPLFLPTRRPPKPPEKPEPEAPAPKAGKLNLRLTSIVVTPEEQFALAHVKGKGDKGQRRLRAGDEYNGWEVVVVLPYSVKFRSGERARELTLRRSGPPKNHLPPVKLDLPQRSEAGSSTGGESDNASNSKG